MTVVVAGAGWSGAVIARRLADTGHQVDVYERRSHVAGNCHTERRDGVMAHAYGPHIFHTDNETVWDWVRQWGEFHPYRLKVMSTARGRVYSMPVNLHTVNQVYETAWVPRQTSQPAETVEAVTFEDAAIAAVGERIYRLLFAGYTAKQWGIDPKDLPASVFKRLPVRFDYDDSYFTHPYQAIPVDGYTHVFNRILDHPNITVHLNTDAPRDGRHVFWTGPLDAWFDHQFGRLRYRTLDIQWMHGPRQGVALMNWPDPDVPWTRVTEHNLLAPWEKHQTSLCSFEHPRDAGPDDEPFYPLRLAHDRTLLDRYIDAANQETGVTFLGRLGTYRYLDMDVAIAEAHNVADRFLAGDIRPLYVNP